MSGFHQAQLFLYTTSLLSFPSSFAISLQSFLRQIMSSSSIPPELIFFVNPASMQPKPFSIFSDCYVIPVLAAVITST